MLLFPWGLSIQAESINQKQFIYDYAELLTEAEVEDLESLSSELSEQMNTAFMIITVNGTEGKDIVPYVEDFYDEYAPGYDQPHGNTAILTIDLEERDVYLAGFKKAEQYLDSARLDMIRNKITPDLSEGKYFQAFSGFINTAHDYMGYEPGVNPENILFKWWFQLAASVTIAGIVVALMAYRSGGRVTVGAQDYMNSKQSGVISKYDNYVRQTVTKQKKPSSNTNSGGGGGGGISRGGHSHSGSRGKF
ncbi:TPM domain-containing protein [Cytobacillus sp. FJAT-53684]|uniref:TPM domain-containing protein n=1 Tax=Cytobacillus mangrovibacter TaxID=3299024 RepID=A0ABW6K3B0_9BACI